VVIIVVDNDQIGDQMWMKYWPKGWLSVVGVVVV